MISGTSLGKTDNTSSITVCGGTDNSKGGSITIYGKDRTNNNGEFSLVANDGTSSSELWGKPNGTLTWGNKKIDTIEEQGEGYIRYSNGIQICWGKISHTGSGTKWATLYESHASSENYPKSFISAPAVTAGSSGEKYCMIESAHGSTTHTPDFYAVRSEDFTDFRFTIDYIAIGRWK